MYPTRVSTARRKKKVYTGRNVMMAFFLGIISVGLFAVMVSTVLSAYSVQSESPTAEIVDELQAAVIAEPASQAADEIRAIMTKMDRNAHTKRLHDDEDVERLTRTEGTFVQNYDHEADYPQLMKDTLKAAQEDEANAQLYLALAEIYECQQNLKTKDTGKGEITHIFNKFNEDLAEMDSLLYETYPFYPYTQHDVVRLASIVYAEAGSSFTTTEHQRDVASVPVNRVLKGGFGGKTLDAVIDEDGQYPATHNNRKYTQREWDNALYVLQHGPTTTGVYQANFVVSTAKEVLKIYEYPGTGARPTYICR